MGDEMKKVPKPEWKDTVHGLVGFMDDVCLSVQDVSGVWWWSVTSAIEVTLGGECSTKERAVGRAECVAAELWRAEQYNALCAKVAELQATILDGHVMLPGGRVVKVLGELPMTADGCIYGLKVPEVFAIHEGAVVRAACLHDPEAAGDEGYGDDSSGCFKPSECYSTREAAEASRGGV